ncbi:MAG: pyridine nucleotide-disulfide oxidoreductase [Coxiellaceae bacterium]|nr:pyridine nucleotide-disulfide oxidoreductase [Coxiellaceae bacterium]
MTAYAWAVVGAGPAGIIAVGKLLDQGVKPESLLWIDPAFAVGDLGKTWMNVSSNTKVDLFIASLKATKAFDYAMNCDGCALEDLDPDDTCQLSNTVAPFKKVTDYLLTQVTGKQTTVTALTQQDKGWQLQCANGDVLQASQVVLCVGAEPKSLNQAVEEMPLQVALNPERVSAEVNPDNTVAVFGSSHSAVLVIKNLLERGCNVVNFYRSPLLYAIYHGDWIEYDNTGLKGLAARWAKQNLESKPYPNLTRYPSDAEHIAEYLPACQQAVYAVGFSPRQIDGVDCSEYDPQTGVIAPGLYGFGIAFPESVTDRAGHRELSVGVWKFNNYAERVIPQWVANCVSL